MHWKQTALKLLTCYSNFYILKTICLYQVNILIVASNRIFISKERVNYNISNFNSLYHFNIVLDSSIVLGELTLWVIYDEGRPINHKIHKIPQKFFFSSDLQAF